MPKKVEIFTDGSCLGNPGQGGYCAILRYLEYERIFSKGYYLTTNNRMELIATIVAIEALKGYYDVTLNTDSMYVYNGITQWIYNWEKHNWKTINKNCVKNVDLWKKLYIILNKQKIKCKWIQGHTGHLENERCNEIARTAALNPTQKDYGYRHS